ncbi:MAG TPA: hypothetical protein VIV60_21420 [Polyangiaceae bacterium]
MIALERLRLLVAAPLASSAAAPDHWIDVCSERWVLNDSERARLKRFLEALPPPAVSATPAPGSPPTPQ